MNRLLLPPQLSFRPAGAPGATALSIHRHNNNKKDTQ